MSLNLRRNKLISRSEGPAQPNNFNVDQLTEVLLKAAARVALGALSGFALGALFAIGVAACSTQQRALYKLQHWGMHQCSRAGVVATVCRAAGDHSPLHIQCSLEVHQLHKIRGDRGGMHQCTMRQSSFVLPSLVHTPGFIIGLGQLTSSRYHHSCLPKTQSIQKGIPACRIGIPCRLLASEGPLYEVPFPKSCLAG